MSADALPLLREYLHQQRARGITHVILRPDAARLVPTLSAPRQKPVEPAPIPVAASAPVERKPVAKSKATTSALLDVPGATREEKLARLAAMAEDCAAARALGTLRDTMVFAVGDPNASVMFIGEAPGAEEERQREPFVGPAGQLLTKIIKAMGLDRAQVYISNICKFRPALEEGEQGSKNRQPTAAEMQSCLPFILTEIDIIRPRVIIALGATACAGLGIEGSVSRNRGREHAIQGIPVVVTYHPSYLLRQEQEAGGGMQTKRMCWEDILIAMEKAALPISEKQRGFFQGR